MIKVDFILYSDTVITMDKRRRIIYKGAVAILGNLIVAVDEAVIIDCNYCSTQQLNLGSDVLLPGFVNGHAHSPMTLLRGCNDDAPLTSWLRDTIFPLEKAFINSEFTYWGTMLALLEMIRGGITTMVDMYWHVEGIAQACNDMNMRAIIGSTILHHNHELEKAQQFVEKWEENMLVTPACAPHSTAEVPLDLLKEAFQMAEEYNVPYLIHIDETAEGVQQVHEKYGISSVELLYREALMNERCVFAHVVHPKPEDISKIAEAAAGIIHCPTSNMKLASGIAPILDMFKMGCLVGLGTDGAASNNSLSIFSEMKLAVLLQRVHNRQADCLNAMTVLEAATIRGAQAIHRDHEIGSLEVGKKADIISVSLHHDHQLPAYDPVSTIVFASNPYDVNTVIINGVLKVQCGELIMGHNEVRKIQTEVVRLKELIAAQL